MKTYNITMDDGHNQHVKANSAADAIQTALERHLGHRVTKCTGGNAGMGIYDIPKHDPIAFAPAKREKRVQKPESPENEALRTKHTPWIEDWLKTTGATKVG